MASAFSPAIASVAIGRGMNLKESIKFWFLGMICAIIPDADVIGFRLGIPYEHPFGHRGFTHSIFFALFFALLVTKVFYSRTEKGSKWIWIYFFLFLSTISHGILDACTNGGLGVAFFFPFDNSRYFFPWHPIRVSPIGVAKFFGEKGIWVLKSEFVWGFHP